MKTKIHIASALQYGIVMGLSFCLYTIFMWLTKLDTRYLNFGQYFDMVVVLIPLIIIGTAINKEKKLQPINFYQRIKIAILVGAISYLIYDPFLYVYHHFINPDWFTSVLALKKKELMDANMPQEQIIRILQKMTTSDAAKSGLFRPSTAIVSVIVLPILIAFIFLVPFRKPNGLSRFYKSPDHFSKLSN